MISHTHLGVSDLERAVGFYGAVMGALGYVLKFHEPENGWAGWMRPGLGRPLFLVGAPHDGGPRPRGRPRGRDRAYATALLLGGGDEGAPGLRPHYHPHHYGAYFRDLDGNKLGVCCHEPPGSAPAVAT